jgi:serine protease Do
MTYNNDYENNNNFKPEDELNQEEQKSYSNPPMICATYEQTEKKGKESFLTKKAAAALFVLCIGTSSILGFGGGYLAGNQNVNNQAPQTQNVSDNGDDSYLTKLNNTSNGTSLSVSEIAAKAQNSVVEIKTEAIQTGNFMRQYVSEGAGSGVIISSDGYIVTNNHAIENAQNITVTLRDGTSYSGKLVGTDSKNDVAIIKIEATGLSAAEIGDSSSLQVGDLAVAIGNPLGELGGTVTDGIISALDREITLGNETMTLLQTNAAINPGNSGGGLFNEQGQLVGIVVAKSSGSDVEEGLGFAIPINNVKDVISDLQNYGYVKGRPVLGI